MSYKLVIVESPAKAKTIEKYLGQDYKVTSSYGHIRDLSRKQLGVKVDEGFKPDYEIPKDKQKIVKDLRQLKAQASEVILAADQDREGEAIAWHLCQALDLDPQTTKRLVFHEITDQAIQAAIKQPQTINQALVDAQQARRILDRLVGFELSPLLWKKIARGLSAGRVQSVAVRLINEREGQIRDFESESSFHLKAVFKCQRQEVQAVLETPLASLGAARDFLAACQGTKFTVASLKQTPASQKPPAPFKTSTLQQEAANLLGWGVSQTMSLAQKLYEAGQITYMRTDSLNLSQVAIRAAASYIKGEYGDQYHQSRNYQSRGRAQEAHEAIRPTDFRQTSCGQDDRQKKLYDLIRRRTLASQMAAAKVKRTTVKIALKERPEQLTIRGQELQFDGFLKIYGPTKDDIILPTLAVGDELTLVQMNVQEKFSRPPARYSEASLVSKLEALEIGRPSTYAPTIKTILDRGYVTKDEIPAKQRRGRGLILENGQISDYDFQEPYGGAKNKLVPTPLAGVVVDFLCQHFSQIMDYKFTSQVEADFDRIARNELAWQDQLSQFYSDFQPLVAKAVTVSRDEVAKKRQVGIDPGDQWPIYARQGRYGPVLQKENPDDDSQKPVFAPLPDGTTIETVTLEAALEAFKLPKSLGRDKQDREVWAKIGRFGAYVERDKTRASLGELDPHSVTLEQAQELLDDKEAADRQKIITDFGQIKILNGHFGAYVTDGQKNASVPKDTDPQTLDKEAAIALLNKPKRPRWNKKKS